MKQLIQIENNKIIRQLPLKKNEYTLGRGSENDIVLDSGKVSRLHATLIIEGDTYSIVDKGARNHIFVNGERVTRRRLASGDRINLSREIVLLYLSAGEVDDKLTHILNRMWELAHKEDLLRLKEVTNRIISLDNLDNILNVILSEAIKLVNAERGFIALINENGEVQTDTSIIYNIPLDEDRIHQAVFSHSIVRQVIKNKRNVFILNTEDSSEHLSDSVFELNLRSIMCSPLLFGRQLLGILYVDSGYHLADFSEMDQFLFTILADHAAIAIKNSKLYSRVRSSNEQLKVEIRESEVRYRQLVDFSPDAIAVHSGGKIVFVNPAAVKMMGAKNAKELIGKPTLEMVHPEYRDVVKKRMSQKTEESVPAPLLAEKFLRLDGSPVEVEVVGVPLTYQGKPAVQIIARDITERKHMEQELLRAQKLESVGVLAGGIAHDFNNILQVIKGNTLLGRANPEDKRNLELCFTDIEKACDRAVKLTSQLLTFSKGGTPVTEAASIEAIIEESAAFALRGSNVAYKLEFADNLPVVEIDSDQINQVLHNLIINAVQAMPNGGTITISAGNVHITKAQPVSSLKEENYVKVSVKDQGIGIAKEDLQKIFDPYFTTKPLGSGLGLASCYSIITKHKGAIEVESEQGKGAAFTFYLPVSTKQPRQYQTEAKSGQFNANVLIMDDDEIIRETLRRMLQFNGCQVEAASNGTEAVGRYKKAKESGHPFDLVIFDLTVPGGMGGRGALKELKVYDPGIKAIVASGYSHNPVMANPKEFGFQGVLSKPFSLQDLVRVMESVYSLQKVKDG